MKTNSKPNILVIYPDQLRYDSLSCTGNKVVKTPNIDNLASTGVDFTKAYNSFPLCCPFRASLMTGKYAHSHQLYANHYPIPLAPINDEFLPDIMNRNGYSTGWIGKWHLAGGKKSDFVPKELRCGFETFIGFTRGHTYDKSVFYRDDDTTPRKSHYFEPVYQTKHLFEFIDKSVENNKPFFGVISYGMPHPPLVAPEEYLNAYSPDSVVLSPNVPSGDEQKSKEFLAKYYGLVKMVDNEVGNIIENLKKRNMYENTVIIFVSDHGEMAGEYGLYHKRYIYESSMHVPLFIHFPESYNYNGARDVLVDPSVDIFPTILDICGIEVPDYAEGRTMIPQCNNQKDTKRNDYIYYENMTQPYPELDWSFEGLRGIRNNHYVYVEKLGGIPSELYDLLKDPIEQHNVINNQDYKNVVKQLHTFLTNKMREMNDDWGKQENHTIIGHQKHKEAVEWGNKLYNCAVYDD